MLYYVVFFYFWFVGIGLCFLLIFFFLLIIFRYENLIVVYIFNIFIDKKKNLYGIDYFDLKLNIGL